MRCRLSWCLRKTRLRLQKRLQAVRARLCSSPVALPNYDANPTIAVIEADQPKLWFARAAKLLRPRIECEWIHETAAIGPKG